MPVSRRQLHRVVRWEDPPQTRGGGRKGRGDPDGMLNSLKMRPGEWGVVNEDVSIGARYNKAAIALRDAGCDITMRQTDPARRRFTLYARWPSEQSHRRARRQTKVA